VIDGSEVLSRIGRLVTLRRTSDFDRVFREGKRHRGRAVALLCLPRTEGGLRAAFVAGKAVGGAVQRNRQRRRLREACRALWTEIAERPADIVFLAQPPAADTDFAGLRAEMEALLRRAGVLPAAERGRRRASR